jgi:hypothetical protein
MIRRGFWEYDREEGLGTWLVLRAIIVAWAIVRRADEAVRCISLAKEGNMHLVQSNDTHAPFAFAHGSTSHRLDPPQKRHLPTHRGAFLSFSSTTELSPFYFLQPQRCYPFIFFNHRGVTLLCSSTTEVASFYFLQPQRWLPFIFFTHRGVTLSFSGSPCSPKMF